MDIVGIITEYNPFHRGHLYQIEQVRALLGPDTGVVCVMSGSFVQRGDFAIIDKWARAEAAVASGTDLVLELPLPYVLASAEGFARGGVSLLAATGVVTHLAFGAEAGNLKALMAAARILDGAGETIADKMSGGLSYAAACEVALRESGGDGDLLTAPNNTLGIEYLRALWRLDAPITPLCIPRAGAGHDSLDLSPEIVSAAAVRQCIARGEDPSQYLPAPSAAIIRREQRAGRAPVTMAGAEQALIALLRRGAETGFSNLPDLSEGLENRLKKAVRTHGSVHEVIGGTKTRRYPESRIRRLILSACLGIRAEDRLDAVPFIKILAFGSRGRRMLREMSSTATVPVLTRHAAARKVSPAAARMAALEAAATDLYVLGSPDPKQWRPGREWREGPRIGPFI